MNVTGYYVSGIRQTDVNENTNPLNNYFRIEEYAEGNISFVDGINSNTGYFKLDNLLHHSTTASHEFGHTLGLVHPNILDIRGHGVPGIMYPRGTVCDAEYQYDPNAQPLAPGGTMNPQHRKVLQQDIDNLNLEKLRFNGQGKAVIGDFTSEWHYAHFKQ
ncbi:MAG: peptidase M10 [Ferruginibacter sp.]|nr:peptidase M10 [Ferruginibacter sp.]